METLRQLLAQVNGADPGSGQENQSQGTQEADPGGETEPVDSPKSLFNNPIIPIILMFVVLYFFLFRGPRKKQRAHKNMLGAMKKNDRVKTIGGIIGTVVDVRDHEVVLKIDETNNVKMHFARSAISQVFAEGEQVS